METRELILESTIELFNENGLKFTMDDLAARLGMSKKTIYHTFKDKKTLFLEMVDYVFDNIKRAEQEIYEQKDLSTLEKLQQILIAMPKRYENMDFRKLYALKDDDPDIYKKIEHRLETGWERTVALMMRAMEEKVIRPVCVPVFQAMVEGTIENFLRTEGLMNADISYKDALKEMIDILMNGIKES